MDRQCALRDETATAIAPAASSTRLDGSGTAELPAAVLGDGAETASMASEHLNGIVESGPALKKPLDARDSGNALALANGFPKPSLATDC
jgi:hypothetical protein